MNPHHEANRALWNQWTPFHERAPMYRVDRFRAGESTLLPQDQAWVGDVTGRSLLHLQCHFGLDTLSWARLGARVTGVDISDEAIDLARRLASDGNIPARFIRCDLLDLPAHLDETFDIVFTSYGVLPWLSDLPAWGRIVARYLKPGGRFHVIDGHPFSDVFQQTDGATGFENLRVAQSYFARTPWHYVAQRSYAMTAEQAHPPTTAFEFHHTLGDVINAIASAGLRIERVEEHGEHPYARFFFQADDGSGRNLDPQARVPVLFSLVASKT
jgi:SAM-dependent methyltransferase